MFGAKETKLLQRLLDDDPVAWEEIVGTYSGLLLGLARRTFAAYGFPASTPDCEDVAAEVWSNLLRDERQLIRRCRERGQLLPTLYVLVRNRSIDLMRRRQLVTQPLAEELREVPAPDAAAEPAPDLVDRLRQALPQLTTKERTLVELFYLQKKKYREIELLTGISQNSIGPTLARALARLRDALAGNKPERCTISDAP